MKSNCTFSSGERRELEAKNQKLQKVHKIEVEEEEPRPAPRIKPRASVLKKDKTERVPEKHEKVTEKLEQVTERVEAVVKPQARVRREVPEKSSESSTEVVPIEDKVKAPILVVDKVPEKVHADEPEKVKQKEKGQEQFKNKEAVPEKVKHKEKGHERSKNKEKVPEIVKVEEKVPENEEEDESEEDESTEESGDDDESSSSGEDQEADVRHGGETTNEKSGQEPVYYAFALVSWY